MPDAIPKPGLAARLREGTRDAHRAAERVSFIKDFMRGRIDRDGYRAYLVALWQIYGALEAGLQRHRDHPIARALALPKLYRTAALTADLRELFDCDPVTEPARPAALAYAAELRELADTDPGLLVAHAYTRYLGDLSGGQILRGAAARLLGRTDDSESAAGLAFYDFPEIADIDACKAELRARLDALPLDAAGTQAMVTEARRAFARNAAALAELATT